MAPISMYLDSVLFGEDRLKYPGWQDRGVEDAEDTDFNVRCASTARTVVRGLDTPACMPVEPVKSCTSVRHMLPIYQQAQTRFGRLSGKTTKLEMGEVGTLVDNSTWVMPSDDEE